MARAVHKMEHHEIEEQLTAYLLGDLAPEQADTMRKHLDECDDCRALAKELEPTLDLLRGALAVDLDVPERLDDDRKEEIFAPRHTPATVIWLTQHRSWLMRAAGVAAVAVVLVALMLPASHMSTRTAQRVHEERKLARGIESDAAPSTAAPARSAPARSFDAEFSDMDYAGAEVTSNPEPVPALGEVPELGRLFKKTVNVPEPVVSPQGASIRLSSADDALGISDENSTVSYQIIQGDTLSSIAADHETSVGELVALNELENQNRIQAGGSLALPAIDTASEDQWAVPDAKLSIAAEGEGASGNSHEFFMRQNTVVAGKSPQPVARPAVAPVEEVHDRDGDTPYDRSEGIDVLSSRVRSEQVDEKLFGQSAFGSEGVELERGREKSSKEERERFRSVRVQSMDSYDVAAVSAPTSGSGVEAPKQAVPSSPTMRWMDDGVMVETQPAMDPIHAATVDGESSFGVTLVADRPAETEPQDPRSDVRRLGEELGNIAPSTELAKQDASTLHRGFDAGGAGKRVEDLVELNGRVEEGRDTVAGGRYVKLEQASVDGRDISGPDPDTLDQVNESDHDLYAYAAADKPQKVARRKVREFSDRRSAVSSSGKHPEPVKLSDMDAKDGFQSRGDSVEKFGAVAVANGAANKDLGIGLLGLDAGQSLQEKELSYGAGTTVDLEADNTEWMAKTSGKSLPALVELSKQEEDEGRQQIRLIAGEKKAKIAPERDVTMEGMDAVIVPAAEEFATYRRAGQLTAAESGLRDAESVDEAKLDTLNVQAEDPIVMGFGGGINGDFGAYALSEDFVDDDGAALSSPLSTTAISVTPQLIEDVVESEEVLEKKADIFAESESEPELVARAYGVNPFVEAATQPFSTFAIDVDTAAYTLTRKHIRNGVLPPAEAVRTEEFVNFFDYDYRAPERQTFAVHTTLAPTPFGDGRLLKIGVKGKRLGREEQRPAVLTFVIDTSGSMDTPDRLGLVRRSLDLLIDELGEADRVAIVQVDTQARLILPPTPLTDRESIKAAVAQLQCSGSTHLEDGIKLGYEVAAQAFTGGAVNRVLLLSDGAANLGSANADQILSMVESHRSQGIFCSVFGFGIGAYNDEILEQLANKGDGSYRFIDSQEEATRVFVDDLAATLHVIASDVKIQVEFFPEQIKTYRQLGYENRQLTKEQFRDDTVDAGEVGSGESVTALYELVPGANTDQPLGVVRVRYRDVATGAIEEIAHPIRMSDAIASFEEADPRFQLAAGVAEFAELLRGSPFAEGSDFDAVADVLRPVALDLRLDQRVQELLQLVQSAPGLPRASGN